MASWAGWLAELAGLAGCVGYPKPQVQQRIPSGWPGGLPNESNTESLSGWTWMGWLAGWAKLVELGWLGWAWMGWLAELGWPGVGVISLNWLLL